jgi:hypothetical protein
VGRSFARSRAQPSARPRTALRHARASVAGLGRGGAEQVILCNFLGSAIFFGDTARLGRDRRSPGEILLLSAIICLLLILIRSAFFAVAPNGNRRSNNCSLISRRGDEARARAEVHASFYAGRLGSMVADVVLSRQLTHPQAICHSFSLSRSELAGMPPLIPQLPQG